MLHAPRNPSWLLWRDVPQPTLRASVSDRVALAAAGGFFGTLARFPAMRMRISLSGLVFDPCNAQLEHQSTASAADAVPIMAQAS